MNIPFELTDETALITGGGTGIGRGIATCMVAAGAQVVLVGRRESELAAACQELGPKAHYVVQDITQFEEADELIQKAEELADSPVSILVNNAGNHLKKLAVDTSVEEFDHVIRTHLLASHALSRAALPGMIKRQHGNLLFMASMTSYMGMPMVVAYSAAKSACLGMVRTLATEVSEAGVRVNGIAPGWIESDMTLRALGSDPARKKKVFSRTPMNRMGQPSDIGWAAVYLCSPAASFITGTVLPVDGGASIGF